MVARRLLAVVVGVGRSLTLSLCTGRLMCSSLLGPVEP